MTTGLVLQLYGVEGGGLKEGKFVQLWWRGAEHLCLASRRRAKFHAQIVELFCLQNDISFQARSDGVCETLDPALRVVGGGRFELDRAHRHLRIFGTSMGYGPFDPRGLDARLGSCDALWGFTVEVAP